MVEKDKSIRAGLQLKKGLSWEAVLEQSDSKPAEDATWDGNQNAGMYSLKDQYNESEPTPASRRGMFLPKEPGSLHSGNQ